MSRITVPASVLAVLSLAPLAGCGPVTPTPGPEASTPVPLDVHGTLAGAPFEAKDAIVVRLPRKKGRGDIAWVVLSSAPDACAAYLDGSLELSLFEPRQHYSDSRFVAWLLFASRDLSGDLAVGPVQHGIPAFEGKSPLPPKGPGAFGFAQAVEVSGTCANATVPFDYPSLTSEVELTSVGTPEEPLAMRFRLAQGTTDLHGELVARPCQPPAGWREAHDVPCRATPTGPRKSMDELVGRPGERRFYPLGEPIGSAGVCFEAELACVAEAPDARVTAVEVTRVRTREGRPAGGGRFPEVMSGDSERWVSHTRKDGHGASLTHGVAVVDGQAVYDLGGDQLVIDLRACADGLHHGVYRTRNPVESRDDAVVCARPETLPGDAGRWRYGGESCR